MGGKVTVLENRTYYNIEMRLWVYPSRPDRFNKTFRIRPGRTVTMDSKYFNTTTNDDKSESGDHHHDQDGGDDHHDALIMVYANGSWTGKYIFPLHWMTYAKFTCDRNQHGQVILRGKRANFNFCRRKLVL